MVGWLVEGVDELSVRGEMGGVRCVSINLDRKPVMESPPVGSQDHSEM